MSELNAHAVISGNHPWSGEFDGASFRARLYEEATWSEDEYWKVEWALFQLVGESATETELRGRVFRLFSTTFSLFAAHFDPNDVYTIKNLTADEVRESMERFQLVFQGFFSGDMRDLLALLDERNPFMDSER